MDANFPGHDRTDLHPDKPAFHDFDELPEPYPDPSPTPAAGPSFLSNLAWLALGVILTAFALGSPGCVAGGRPTVNAKADVSVKETGLVAHAGGPGGSGEVVGTFSVEFKWATK